MPLLNGFLAGMVAVSLIALWQLATGQGRIDVEGVWRVRAFYGSPNNLALVLDRAIPLALALALFGRPRPVWQTVWHWAAAVVMTLACVATFSKGALLLGLPVGLALVLIGGAWRSRRKWPLWLFGGLAAAGAIGLLALFRTAAFRRSAELPGGHQLRAAQAVARRLADGARSPAAWAWGPTTSSTPTGRATCCHRRGRSWA